MILYNTYQNQPDEVEHEFHEFNEFCLDLAEQYDLLMMSKEKQNNDTQKLQNKRCGTTIEN